MKRFITATALTTLMAGGAFAATEAQEVLIQRYMPDIDVSALTDTEVDVLVGIANSGDSRGEIVSRMEALVGESNEVTTELSDAQLETLQSYLPDADIMMLTDADKAQALTIINGTESRAETLAKLQALAMEGGAITLRPLSEAETVRIQSFAPGIDLSELTDAEKLQVLAATRSENASDVKTLIDSYLSS